MTQTPYPSPRTFLGIESSCDETAASVVRQNTDGSGEILSNIILSQIDDHAAYGGVVPEIAARAHVTVIDRVIKEAMDGAELTFADLDGVAVTAGPGLIGGLLVGTMTAKAIAAAFDRPFVPINHLEGHALTATLTDGTAFPYLLLLASGGHTQLILVEEVGSYRRLGSTIDDASGEAFDKVAKLLHLGFPGGPMVEAAAKTGDPARFALPRPLKGQRSCDFSFSGLKTAVRQAASEIEPLSRQDVADLCASFQCAVADIFCDRVRHALGQLSEGGITVSGLVVAGGVASNNEIRGRLREVCLTRDLDFVSPPPILCTDNAAMIAWAGLCRTGSGLPVDPDMSVRSRWPLDEGAMPVLGSGKHGARV